MHHHHQPHDRQNSHFLELVNSIWTRFGKLSGELKVVSCVSFNYKGIRYAMITTPHPPMHATHPPAKEKGIGIQHLPKCNP